MYKYRGKVKCAQCGWAMRGKKARGKSIYICAKYNKDGSCERNKIDEVWIDQLVELRDPKWGPKEVESISVGEDTRIDFFDGSFISIHSKGLTIKR